MMKCSQAQSSPAIAEWGDDLVRKMIVEAFPDFNYRSGPKFGLQPFHDSWKRGRHEFGFI